MRPNALQVERLARWGRRHQLEPESIERVGQMLVSDRREVDLTVAAVHTIPSFLRAELMLSSVTLRLAVADHVELDMARLPRLRTLRIVDSEVRSLRIMGEEPLQVTRRAACSLEVMRSETLCDIELDATTFSQLSVSDLPQLSALDVSAAGLQHITVSRTPRLERFDASMNALPGGGAIELDDVAGLAAVSLAQTQLSDVPAALREMRALRALDLRGNRLLIVPPGVLPSVLLSLDVSENMLVAAPLDNAFQGTLRELKARMNRICCLSDTLGAFKRIEVLDLSHNCLLVLPYSIGRCSLLRVLKLSSNRLSYLPEEICDLVSLEILEVDANMLAMLPANIHRLGRLDSLLARDNMLHDLPARLDEVPLRRLSLRGNPFFRVPPVLLREHTLAGYPAFECLAELELDRIRLVEVPRGLGYRRGLAQLRMRDNEQLRTLPGDFANLRQLRWLDLRGCGFRQLPSVFKRMSIRTDVLLQRNPLDPQVLVMVRQVGSASRQGARIPPEPPNVATCVGEEVARWRALLYRKMTPKSEACWSAQAPFRYAHAFARLLEGLDGIPEFRSASSVGRTRIGFAVNRLLTLVENNPELLDDVLESARMNASTLGDRYRQSFDRLALLAQLHVMSKGARAEGLVAASLMRDAFQRERVAAVAARQAREQAVDTEVTLDLTYRLRLSRETTGSSFDYDAQLAEICAPLGNARVAELVEDLRNAEAHELVDYMVWSPVWRRFLTRLYYTEYLALIDRFDVDSGPGASAGPQGPIDPAAPAGQAPDMAYAWNRDSLLAQREAAVLEWLQRETTALLVNNPLLEAAPEPS